MTPRLKPYPAYKDSGVPWLGDVPKHWEVLPFFAISNPKSEINKQDRELLSVYLNRGVIKFSDVTEKRTNPTSDDLSKYQAVDPGDFVLNNQQAWRGSVGVSDFEGIVSPAYLVLTLSSKLFPKYANRLFRDQSMVTQYLISSKGVGTIQRNLYWPHLKRAATIVPPLPEQHAITRFLDHIDRRVNRFIRAKRKLIALLNEQKQAIIHRAVTRGLDPDAPLKPSGVDWLGEIPAHWELRKLGSLGAFLKGGGIARSDITEAGVPALTYGDIYTRYNIAIKSLSKFTSDEVAAKAQPIFKGDLLFTASGETLEEIGKTVLYCGDETGYAGGDIIILRLRNGYGHFLSYALNSHIGLWQKSTFGRGDIIVHISASKLRQVLVPLPPLREQQAIASFLDRESHDLDVAIEKARREIDLIREYRTRLIADVVTGKLDVRAAAAALADDWPGDDTAELDGNDGELEDEPEDELEAAFDGD